MLLDKANVSRRTMSGVYQVIHETRLEPRHKQVGLQKGGGKYRGCGGGSGESLREAGGGWLLHMLLRKH